MDPQGAEAQDAQQHLALLRREGMPVAGRFQFRLKRGAQRRRTRDAEPGAKRREPAVRRFARVLGCGLAGFGLGARDLPLMAWARPGNGKTLMLARRARGVGILEAERRQNLPLQALHLDGLRLRFVVIADQGARDRAGQDAAHGGPAQGGVARPPRQSSRPPARRRPGSDRLPGPRGRAA